MNAQVRKLATAIVISLLGGASGVALAEATETQHSAYQFAAQRGSESVQAGQAGPAGPSELPGSGRVSSYWVPYESMYSAFHQAESLAAKPVAQAGRAGPVSIGTAAERSRVLETQYSAYDLADRW